MIVKIFEPQCPIENLIFEGPSFEQNIDSPLAEDPLFYFLLPSHNDYLIDQKSSHESSDKIRQGIPYCLRN